MKFKINDKVEFMFGNGEIRHGKIFRLPNALRDDYGVEFVDERFGEMSFGATEKQLRLVED